MWRSLISELLVPPLNALALGGLGLVLARWRRRAGLAVMIGAALLLVVLSMPGTGALLLTSLQAGVPLAADADLARADAIVVLGAAVARHAPEYGGATVGRFLLERLRYGAHLHRETGHPLLVTGGRLDGQRPSQAELMAQVLRSEWQAEVRWVEDRARNTRENAERTAAILKPQGRDTILLVTHAWHMKRARGAFERAGLDVIEAPTGFRARPRFVLMDFVPSWKGMRDSSLALHEWIGVGWYRWVAGA